MDQKGELNPRAPKLGTRARVDADSDFQVDLFSKDLVLIPINIGNMHWIAAVINFKQKRFEYFDSMGDYGETMEDVFQVSPSPLGSPKSQLTGLASARLR